MEKTRSGKTVLAKAALECLSVEINRNTSPKACAVSAKQGMEAARHLSAVGREATSRADREVGRHMIEAVAERHEQALLERCAWLQFPGDSAVKLPELQMEVAGLRKQYMSSRVGT